MFNVLCTVVYPDTGEFHKRVIDWDNYDARKEFARKANSAIYDGGKVTTEPTELDVGHIEEGTYCEDK